MLTSSSEPGPSSPWAMRVATRSNTTFAMNSVVVFLPANAGSSSRFLKSSSWSDRRGVDLSDQARSAGNVSTIAFAIGAAGLASGAILWFTGETQESAATPRLGVGPAGLSVTGRF